MKITFDEFGVVLQGNDDCEKAINYDVFIESMARMYSHTRQFDLLPPNTLALNECGNTSTIVLQYKARCFKVTHDNSDSYVVPTPNILLYVKYRSENSESIKLHSVRKFSLYASPHPITSYDDPIYACPFGNMFSTDEICWGNLALPYKFETLSSFNIFYESYFGSTFNDDLQPILSNEVDPPLSCSSLLGMLDATNEFPEHLLFKTSHTLRTLMNT